MCNIIAMKRKKRNIIKTFTILKILHFQPKDKEAQPIVMIYGESTLLRANIGS